MSMTPSIGHIPALGTMRVCRVLQKWRRTGREARNRSFADGVPKPEFGNEIDVVGCHFIQNLRRQDLNLGPPSYEPGELPLLHAAPSESRLPAPRRATAGTSDST